MLKHSIVLMSVILFVSSRIDASSCHGGSSGSSDHSNQHVTKKVSPQSDKANIQTVCPVMEKSIDHTIYADWEGDEKNTPKRVYLCCGGCKEQFNKKPARYVRKLRKLGQHVENNFQNGQ